MDKKEKTGVLNVRDLVNVGLFSVLIFIATFLSGMIGFIPVLMPVVPFVYGIVSGPVYMLYFTKIKKAGMLFIQTIVVTLAFVATGHGPWVLLTAVIGGLLGEVVLRNGRYKSVNQCLNEEENCNLKATDYCPVRRFYLSLQEQIESELKHMTFEMLRKSGGG